MNLLDRAIGAIAPGWALSRVASRQRMMLLNSGYSHGGASYAKKSMIGWCSGTTDADEDIVDNIETLRERSRMLFMTAPIATGALKTIRTNVVGSGLSLNAQVDSRFLGLSDEEAREWEANAEREWRLWAESVACDAERRQNFYQLQSLVVLSTLMSGDCFVVMPMIRRAGSIYDMRVGIIEADRVCNPLSQNIVGKNVLGGVEVGKYGDAVAVYVANKHPRAIPRALEAASVKWTRVPIFGERTGRRNVLHVMTDVERPAQRRGVPILAPVIEELKQLKRYSDAELMAAVISGMFTVFVTTPNPSEDEPFGGGGLPAMQRVDPDPQAYELGNGAIVQLAEGEKVEIADPKRPSVAFDGYVQAVCRHIGAALEIPYELLLKHFTSSYSASRAALLEAWKMFRMRRDWLVSSFCQPVYEEWLAEAVAKGRIKAPGFFSDPAVRAAWSGAEWHGDAQGQLDPLKEANAAVVRVKNGFSTISREAAEMTGMRMESIVRTRTREEALLKAAGLSTSGGTIEEKEEKE